MPTSPLLLRACALIATTLFALACSGRGATEAGPTEGSLDASVAPPPAEERSADKAGVLAAARDAIARDALKLTERAGAWSATHAAQGHTTRIDATGATMKPASGGAWKLGLHVTRIGRQNAMREVRAGAPVERKGRVELDRGDGVREWFFHDAQGLEQGIDLASKPAGDGALVVEVAVEGMTAVLAKDGSSVELRGEKGEQRLTYGKLAVKGADGKEVPARMSVEGGRVVLRVEDAGARWPVVVDPLVWGVQRAEMLAGDGAANDLFGSSVAISGSTAIVGACGKTVGSNVGQGAAYIFTQTGGTWSQVGPALHSGDGAAYDYFGISVAISGGTIVVGAPENLGGRPGAAYVFTFSGTSWAQQARLAASDGGSGDGFGESVSISGTTAIVGAPNHRIGQGAAYVFVQSGTSWVQEAKLVASDGAARDSFATSVSVSGSSALIGAPGRAIGASTYQGTGYVFVRTGTSWSLQGQLLASDGASFDGLGNSVALDGSTALLGASGKNIAGTLAQGAGYVFVRAGVIWTQQARLIASDGTTRDSFGQSVSLSGTTAILGSEYHRTSRFDLTKQGAAYMFVRSGTAWSQQVKLVAADSRPTEEDGFSSSVALDGALAVVGASGKFIGPVQSGAAYVFEPAGGPGDSCKLAADCTSGFCIDGVCCRTACASICQSCAGRSTGGPDGTCGFVIAGADPRGDCPGISCAADLLSTNTCDGVGSCKPKPVSCLPFHCKADGSDCLKNCATDADCGTASYCGSDGTCSLRKARAATCSAGKECASGACADGVCCDRACTGECEACAEPSDVGTCLPIKGTPRTGHPACSGSDPACAGLCDGIHAATCAYPSVGTSCGAGCTDGKLAVCDNTGTCLTPASCAGNFACDGTTKCRTSCTAATDCASGFVCDGSKCVPAPKGTCSDDGSSSKAPSGVVIACAPYRCDPSTGACRTTCGTTSDCAAGSTCDTTKSPVICVPPAGTGSTGGCQLASTQRSAGSAGAVVAWGVVALAISRRRRRRSA